MAQISTSLNQRELSQSSRADTSPWSAVPWAGLHPGNAAAHVASPRGSPDPAYGLTQVANREEVTSSGDDRARTDDPRLAKAVLSQLSYVPSPSSSPIRRARQAGVAGKGGPERVAGTQSGQPGRFGATMPLGNQSGGHNVWWNRISASGRTARDYGGRGHLGKPVGASHARPTARPVARTARRRVAGGVGRRGGLSGVWVRRVRRLLCCRAAASMHGGSAAEAG